MKFAFSLFAMGPFTLLAEPQTCISNATVTKTVYPTKCPAPITSSDFALGTDPTAASLNHLLYLADNKPDYNQNGLVDGQVRVGGYGEGIPSHEAKNDHGHELTTQSTQPTPTINYDPGLPGYIGSEFRMDIESTTCSHGVSCKTNGPRLPVLSAYDASKFSLKREVPTCAHGVSCKTNSPHHS